MNLNLIILLISSVVLPSYGEQKAQVESASKLSTQSASTELDPHIPPDDLAKYKSVQDAQDWQNPYLVVQKDGVAFRCLAIAARDWQIIPPAEMKKRLLELPVAAWPYGRVIAVQEIGIRSKGDDKYIAANKAKVVSVLKSLGIRINPWPS